MKHSDILSIGDIAKRTGLAVSAIRYYETMGLITPHRNAGGHRRYMRSDIRRLSFVMIAQQLGFSINEIVDEMRNLPNGRTPNARDWKKISGKFLDRLDDQIAALTRTRNNLTGCVGCGCLSLDKCTLYNPQDEQAAKGPGPRLAMIKSDDES
ncbi:MAG: redox-sensitive transcriptional activator SoxR [Ponticaulis sp.]|mgnify:CR=1 FL=1|nr:redox-sensitive transcriptional activator SoxR [Ponticaulis sp.]